MKAFIRKLFGPATRTPIARRPRLGLESLGDRIVPAGFSWDDAQHTLTITGTNSADQITAHVDVADANTTYIRASVGSQNFSSEFPTQTVRGWHGFTAFRISGGGGDDTIRITTAAPPNTVDYPDPAAQRAYIDGNDGNDTLYGGAGNDTLLGGAGNDYLDAGAGDDYLYGTSGNDYLFGGDGNDHMKGQDGDDYLDGGAGADDMDGNDGNDRLYGGDGNDQMYGGAGNDYLQGDNGNDVMYGCSGSDTMAGGAGNDDYYYDRTDTVYVGSNDTAHRDSQPNIWWGW